MSVPINHVFKGPFGPLFGTFDKTTATPAEATWSSTVQTAFANFVKDPDTSPALSWPKYVPGPPAQTFAKLAYNGNVDPDNFVDPVASNSLVLVISNGTPGWTLQRALEPVFGLSGLNSVESHLSSVPWLRRFDGTHRGHQERPPSAMWQYCLQYSPNWDDSDDFLPSNVAI
ncbi:hypothetical protein B0H17DRAFT_1130045 [Mycena rosella]|uniref:Uncharacterized protein n=1 Tax=Mycena rosella TaxID=1033263 RepID=A0AAD7GJM4_MYCRO|nr:hypothetical protein B0H17DRAFT_1130045 [Mycena rosella]